MTTALAIPEPTAPAVQLDEAQVRRVHDEIAAVVAAADEAIETLRTLCGPEPGDFASQLRVKLNMGAGYFRSCAADIEAAWRARNVRRKQEQGGDTTCHHESETGVAAAVQSSKSTAAAVRATEVEGRAAPTSDPLVAAEPAPARDGGKAVAG